MDSATINALGDDIVYIQWFAWLDIEDDPLRSVTGVQSIQFDPGETGDPDLDGHLFEALPSNLVDVSEVTHSETGSQTVTATLSGLPIENADLLAIVDDKSRWRKREARLWFRTLEPATYGAGGQPTSFTPNPIHSYYSGFLVNMNVQTGDGAQTISAKIENYQTMLTQASGLTYLHQGEFDPDDLSASQTLAAANGMAKAGVSSGGGGGSHRWTDGRDLVER